MLRAEAELGKQRPGLAREQPGCSGEHFEQSNVRHESLAPLVELADDDTGTEPPLARLERQPSENRVERRRLARTVWAEDPDSLGPADLEIDRAQPETAALDHRVTKPHDVSAARRGRDREAQLPLLERLVDHLQSVERLLSDAHLGCLLLGPVEEEVALRLVVVLRVLRQLLGAHRRPPPLGLRPSLEVGALVAVLLERLSGVAARDLARVEVSEPASVVERCRMRLLVELEHRRHRPLQEGAVVRDDDEPGVERRHPALNPVETVEVEVVGGLVEQKDVETRQQQRGERGAGGLAAGEGTHLKVERGNGERQVVAHRGRASLEVGTAERQVALERLAVLAVVASLAERGRGVFKRLLGRRHTGSPAQEVAERLARTLGLLGQVADRRRRRDASDRPRIGHVETGEDAQQRRLAGAVGSDQTDVVAGRDRQVDGVEHGVGAMGAGHASGVQGCSGHDALLEELGGLRESGSLHRPNGIGSGPKAPDE